MRQFLESLCHEENCFVTLTYAPEHVPPGRNVVPRDLQLFLKRLRTSIHPIRFRYFAVGEYGDLSGRPHYHLSAFGLGQHMGPIIDKAWGLGHTLTAEFNSQTAQYVAGYTIKKMTSFGDHRLDGRHPEFARQSRRPGLGADAMSVIAQALEGASFDDAPSMIQVGSRKVALGRYLLSKLRAHLQISEEQIAQTKQDRVWDIMEELQALWTIEKNNPNKSKASLSQKHSLIAANLGRIRAVEGRLKLGKKGTL